MTKRHKQWHEDAELNDPELGDSGDPDSPEFQEEMFKTYQYQGLTPADFPVPAYAAKYAAWLRDHRD